MPAFFIRDCARCGVKKIQHFVSGQSHIGGLYDWEVSGACTDCSQISVYKLHIGTSSKPMAFDGNIERHAHLSKEPARTDAIAVPMSEHIPERIADLFTQANMCRQMRAFDASGAMYRKVIDVSTRHIYATDPRLVDKKAADARRVRIKSLGDMKILDEDIVELADVAALDGNDAAHDVDPYTAGEAEALEELTMDLLDRLFVRPAKLAAVRAKQVAAGQRRE